MSEGKFDLQRKTPQKEANKSKESYSKPEVKDFGSLVDLTHSGGSGSADLLGMQSAMGMN